MQNHIFIFNIKLSRRYPEETLYVEKYTMIVHRIIDQYLHSTVKYALREETNPVATQFQNITEYLKYITRELHYVFFTVSFYTLDFSSLGRFFSLSLCWCEFFLKKYQHQA